MDEGFQVLPGGKLIRVQPLYPLLLYTKPGFLPQSPLSFML